MSCYNYYQHWFGRFIVTDCRQRATYLCNRSQTSVNSRWYSSLVRYVVLGRKKGWILILFHMKWEMQVGLAVARTSQGVAVLCLLRTCCLSHLNKCPFKIEVTPRWPLHVWFYPRQTNNILWFYLDTYPDRHACVTPFIEGEIMYGLINGF